MINLTESELYCVLAALDESKCYDPDLDMVEEVSEMLLSKLPNKVEE